MTDDLMKWAIRHRISPGAMNDLRRLFNTGIADITPANGEGHSESNVQSRIRLEAARKGIKLWRNNVGVLMNEYGTPVRYGLANDSKKLNETVKSGDLIGWRPVQISPAHVGTIMAQFVSRECKREDWTYSGTEHEIAQLRWIQAVAADGGDATFATGEGTL